MPSPSVASTRSIQPTAPCPPLTPPLSVVCRLFVFLLVNAGYHASTCEMWNRHFCFINTMKYVCTAHQDLGWGGGIIRCVYVSMCVCECACVCKLSAKTRKSSSGFVDFYLHGPDSDHFMPRLHLFDFGLWLSSFYFVKFIQPAVQYMIPLVLP